MGLVVAFLIIHSYLEEEDACKYLVNASTYARPPRGGGALSTLPLCRGPNPNRPGSLEEGGGGGGTYRPVAMRDSWCIPTYVSYNDSMEWSGSYSGEHTHTHSHSHSHHHPQQRPLSDASLLGVGSEGEERGPHSESNGSVSSATTQPYLRLSTTGSDQAQLVET